MLNLLGSVTVTMVYFHLESLNRQHTMHGSRLLNDPSLMTLYLDHNISLSYSPIPNMNHSPHEDNRNIRYVYGALFFYFKIFHIVHP